MRTDYTLPRKTNDSLIARVRLERGLTQKQLADKIAVTQQQVGSWENGIRKPKLNALMKIAKALNIELEELLSEYGGKNE